MALQIGTIGHLRSLFARGPDPIFLLGAGASVTSGIPLARELAEKIAIWGYRIDRWGPGSENISFLENPYIPRSDWLPWLERQEWYETNEKLVDNYPNVVEKILRPQDVRKEFFLEIINPKVPPSSGYKHMAELMARKHIRIIFTTNFDTILPNFCQGNRRPHYVNVIQTSGDYTKFSADPQHPQIIYLHGSVEHYTDKNTLTEINEKLDPELVSELVRLLRDHPLVVIGYRGAEPSVMKHLLIDQTKESRGYRHGIFWCVRNYQKEGTDSLTPCVRELADLIPRNFQIIPIDGFDEAMNEIWEFVHDLQSNSVPLQTTENPEKSIIDSYDLQPIKESSLEDFEWSTLKSRLIQYCKKLNILVPDTDDDSWVINELCKQNVVSRMHDEKICPTNGGYLLFAVNPQNYIQYAKVKVCIKGNPKWIERVFGDSEADDRISTSEIEQTIEGNLWSQLDAIYDILTLVNQPFLLKGEVSATVQPYPPAALREIVVNALVHRDYTQPEPILIEIQQKSIQVRNPGGLVPEVVKQVKDILNFQKTIKEGIRGITDCRNRVVADLFYGVETMEKAGSGLSDACRSSNENKNQIEFGPIDNNTAFEVRIQCRPEIVDEVTRTAYHSNFVRYATNLLEFVKLPNLIWHAETKAKKPREVLQNANPDWVPPFIIHSGRLFSFHNLSIPINPLYCQINVEDIRNMDVIEFTKNYGEQRFVWMLKESFYRHLEAQGLWIDKTRMRAYFPRTEEDIRRITYRARIRNATRTVVKKKHRYWEHKSFWFGFESFENTWALAIVPSYVFTTDGKSDLLEGKVVNRLSTQRQSRDYNNVVHNDLVFWSWILSGGQQGTFTLNLSPKNVVVDPISQNQITVDNNSEILLKANVSTTVVENIEPDTSVEYTQLDKQREDKLVKIESEFSEAISQLEEEDDDVYSN